MYRVTNFAMAAIISSFAFASASYAEDNVTMNDGPQIEKDPDDL